ncbi:MAG: gliding motility protein GldC [Salibacteraceae bacterium]
MEKSVIKLEVSLDENHIPEQIEWSATDGAQQGKVNASFLSVWDPEQKNAMTIDLWTKDFTVDEMKLFTYQNIMTMADTFEKATGLSEEAHDMRDFGKYMGKTLGVLKDPEEDKGALPKINPDK